MNETVLSILIIAIALIIILWMFRGTLSRFFLRANKEGVEAELQTHSSVNSSESSPTNTPNIPYNINISDNKQIGADNKLIVDRRGVNISDNLQLGENQSIEVDTDKKKRKKH